MKTLSLGHNWKGNCDASASCIIKDHATGEEIARTSGSTITQATERASYIIRACNAHTETCGSLTELIDQAERLGSNPGILSRARNALAKASL